MANVFKVNTSVPAVVSLTPGSWFLDAALTQAATFPVTVSTTTSWYTAPSGSYTSSVVYSGREYGGQFYAEAGAWPSVNVVPYPQDSSSGTSSTAATVTQVIAYSAI